jgi:acetate kinase
MILRIKIKSIQIQFGQGFWIIGKDKNNKHCLDKEISSSSSLHNVLVIEAKEDLAIAKACLQVYNP